MPRSGTGSYSLPAPYPSGFSNGTLIDAPTMNTVFNDVQTAITASTAADGQTPITGNWAFKGYNISGVGLLTATSATITTLNATDAGVTKSLVVGNGLNVTAGGATITAGGLTVTAGGLTVSSAGANITGNSTLVGSLGGITKLSVASGGAAITGDSTVTGTLTVSGVVAAAQGTKSGQAVTYDQFPVTLASPGTVTLPSGLIVKWGTGTYAAGTGSVTFASNFPTGLLSVQVSLTTAGAAHGSYPPGASPASYAVSGFTVYGGVGQSGSFAWLAIGY